MSGAASPELRVLVLLTILLSACSGANILLTAPFPGSHYFRVLDIGRVLLEEGHRVSFVALLPDDRVHIRHENFTSQSPPPTEIRNRDVFDEVNKGAIMSVMENWNGRELYAATKFADPVCRDAWALLYETLLDYFAGEDFEMIVKEGKFDVIIAEAIMMIPLALMGHKYNIPLAVYSPAVEHNIPRDILNLPYMMNSEPSLFVQVFRGTTPGFWERFVGMYNVVTKAPLLLYRIERMVQPLYKKFGIKDTTALHKTVQLIIVNDHVAFSFPFLLPNNVIQVADMHFREAKPLPGAMKQFIEKQTVPIILATTGSYSDFTWVKWHKDFFEVLEDLDVAVILKYNPEDLKIPGNYDFSDKWYLTPWLPQNDLLGSGLVSLFISHCGNNGRLEGVFNKVPTLCTPLWGDQAINGELVARKGFGEMLLPEEMSKEKIKETIIKMLENREEYISQLNKAGDILKSDPVTGKQTLLYHLNLLLKYKSLDFLINDVIMDQSLVEIYNLDIGLICVLCLLLGLYVFLKFSSAIFVKLREVLLKRKIKTL